MKVIDYGLAWIKGEAKDRVQGTPEYMAPETVEHKLINERTDIYNFGATMYRLVTLQLPPCWVAGEDGTADDREDVQGATQAGADAQPDGPRRARRPDPPVPPAQREQAARSG